MGRFGLLANDTSLADAILSVIQSESIAAKLSEGGIARAAEYAWPRVVDQYEHLYFALLRRPSLVA